MKHVFLNLKRFDVPTEYGGVNRNGIEGWGGYIAELMQEPARRHRAAQFTVFLPEAHITGAKSIEGLCDNIALGCQSVHFNNIETGGNFGALTSSLPASAAAALGCSWTIIGHCEERGKLKDILREGNCADLSAVNRILARSVKCAIESGLKVLYCVGEDESEQDFKENVLSEQLQAVLPYAASGNIFVAYEPIWAIGPGKATPQADYIEAIAKYIKSVVSCPVVYGGGLKSENAPLLASIDAIDGGLIALTRFSGDIGFYPDEYAEIVDKYLVKSLVKGIEDECEA